MGVDGSRPICWHGLKVGGCLALSLPSLNEPSHDDIHFWCAALGVCSANCGRHFPDRMILSHINCRIQGDVIGFQVLLDTSSMKASWWSPSVLQGELSILASVSSGICAVWPNREKCRALDNSRKVWLPVFHVISFCTWWYNSITDSFRKHHWSRALILSMSLCNRPAFKAIQENV